MHQGPLRASVIEPCRPSLPCRKMALLLEGGEDTVSAPYRGSPAGRGRSPVDPPGHRSSFSELRASARGCAGHAAGVVSDGVTSLDLARRASQPASGFLFPGGGIRDLFRCARFAMPASPFGCLRAPDDPRDDLTQALPVTASRGIIPLTASRRIPIVSALIRQDRGPSVIERVTARLTKAHNNSTSDRGQPARGASTCLALMMSGPQKRAA